MSISDAFLGGEQKRNESHLENLVEVALSNGKIVDEERALLEKFAKRLSISKEDSNDVS